jgi:prevent-host-death family protein
MAVVNVHEAKTQLSKLLERIEAGEEIVIARAGVPVARLTPFKPVPERKPGRLNWRLPESFFDPLPEEELSAWE